MREHIRKELLGIIIMAFIFVALFIGMCVCIIKILDYYLYIGFLRDLILMAFIVGLSTLITLIGINFRTIIRYRQKIGIFYCDTNEFSFYEADVDNILV